MVVSKLHDIHDFGKHMILNHFESNVESYLLKECFVFLSQRWIIPNIKYVSSATILKYKIATEFGAPV